MNINLLHLKRLPYSHRLHFMAVLIGTSLSLSGCESNNPIQLIKDAMSNSSSDSKKQFCYTNVKPFNHALCEVAQSELSQSKSGYSLKLIWKSAKWQDKNVRADSNQSLDPLYNFKSVVNDLEPNTKLVFASNAGMYNDEYAPIGYTVINGEQILSLNLNDGGGNFHLLPNGVLWWDEVGRVQITESTRLNTMLKSKEATPQYATQSGPMLVIDGNIHPKFNPDSQSLKIRNGVGVCDDGQIKFVNSSERVNFHQFASYFKDDLNCPNALFLDGGIASALYAPDINKNEAKDMGVIVALVKDTSATK